MIGFGYSVQFARRNLGDGYKGLQPEMDYKPEPLEPLFSLEDHLEPLPAVESEAKVNMSQPMAPQKPRQKSHMFSGNGVDPGYTSSEKIDVYPPPDQALHGVYAWQNMQVHTAVIASTPSPHQTTRYRWVEPVMFQPKASWPQKMQQIEGQPCINTHWERQDGCATQKPVHNDFQTTRNDKFPLDHRHIWSSQYWQA